MGAKRWCNSKDLTGQRFGRLIAKERTELRSNGKVVWLSICDCGNEKLKSSSELINGNTRSCGCLQREGPIQHGLTHTKGYKNHKQARRRSAKICRTPAWADLNTIRKIYEECPEGYHVDHIIPLMGKQVSGLHVPHNLQYLSATENSRKLNKFEPQIITSNR